jgi:K+-transporting ATPase c subunit
MALTKEIVVDKIEVLEMGQVQVRTATRVKEDGAVLSSSFHRHIVVPSTKASGSWADTDISGEDARVQAVATATWTSAVKTAYQEMMDAQTTP